MRAVRGEHGRRIGEVGGRFGITQPRESYFTTAGKRIGRVDSQPIKPARLLHLRLREQCIRFGQVPCFDGFLRISLEGNDLGIVAGLSGSYCL